MDIIDEFHRLSYKRHQQQEFQHITSPENLKNTYFNKDVVAYLMFLHRMKPLEPFLKLATGSCWLTVGDYNRLPCSRGY